MTLDKARDHGVSANEPRLPHVGRGQTARVSLTYLLLVLIPIGATLALLGWAADGGADAPTAPDPAASASAVQPWRLFVALAAVIVGTRLVGWLLSALLQPRAVGEMIAGIALGPSLFGAIAPGGYQWLFAPEVLPYLSLLAQIGLAFFMFLVGLEVDGAVLGGRGWMVAAVAKVSVALPMLLGVAAGLVLYRDFPPDGVGRSLFALFIGVVMSVTAFPVLARILMERGLLQTPLGSLAMICAAIADVAAWLLLAVVVGDLRSDSPASALRTLALTVLFALVVWFAVRPALSAFLRRVPGAGLTVVLVGVLLCGVATEVIGIHLIFGAFLFGAACPRGVPVLDTIRDKIQDVTTSLLLPAFFAFVGLHTQFGLIDDGVAWLWFLALLGVAVAGKLVGTAAGALAVGYDAGTATRLGVLMNCRGLTELVILSIGLDLGLLTPTLFTILVLVALTATLMTTPALAALDRFGTRAPAEARARVPAEVAR